VSTLLKCKVTPGLFSGEVAVRGETADGAEFSLFVPDDFVEHDVPAACGEPIDGWICIDVLAREGALLLVRLPGQTFENGQTITVRDSQIEQRPRREVV
jgi:hypothetical protein